MPKIEMYSKMLCPYCHRAKRTLDELGLDYEVIGVSFKPKLWSEMVERSKRSTVPQIFINGHHVGGSDDLELARSNGQLQKLIDGSSDSV